MLVSRKDETLSFDKSFQEDLATESWTMYGLGMLFIALRIYARIRRNGIKGLTPDDYLMCVAAGWYTMLIVCLNVIASGGGSNLYPTDEFSTFTPEDIKERIKGSKIVIVSEQSMLNTIYTLKACMIFIYTRLTVQLRHQAYVRAIALYVACGYVGTQLAFFLSCRPFKGYWAMPPPSPQCTTLQHYAITQGCFNISSDACLLTISIPLLLKTTLPTKQKVVLVGIFSMGVFIIVAAICTKVYNLSDLYSTVYMLWYVRESSVAIWVTNLPLIWPLAREIFPFLRSFTPGIRGYSSRTKNKGLNGQMGPSIHGIGLETSTRVSVAERGFRLDTIRKKHGNSSISLDSDERELTSKHAAGLGGISTETTVEIEETSVRNLDHDNNSEASINGWRQDLEHGYHVRIHGGEGGRSIIEDHEPVQPRHSVE